MAVAAKLVQRHLPNLLTYLRPRLTSLDSHVSFVS